MHYHCLLQNINRDVRLAASVEPVVGWDGMGWDGKSSNSMTFLGNAWWCPGGGLCDSDGDEKMWRGFHTCTQTVCVMVWMRTSF